MPAGTRKIKIKDLGERFWVHKRHKYYSGEEYRIDADDAEQLVAGDIAEYVGPGRKPKREERLDTFVTQAPRSTGRKAVVPTDA